MIFRTLFLIISIVSLFDCRKIKKVSPIEKQTSFWIDKARNKIAVKLNEKKIESIAKNIILGIGDGMGISTVTSARIFKNQQMFDSNLPDENLNFENFPNVGLSKTYSIDKYVADSAATATAILTGIKTNNGVIGVSSVVQFGKCNSYKLKRDELINIAEMFSKKGKSVGFITTAAIVDATPAAMYASTPSRNWKANIKKNCLVKDIASQFIDKSERFEVVMGGGRKYFISNQQVDPQHSSRNGTRRDNRDLLNEWIQKLSEKKQNKAKYIWNVDDFKSLNTKNITHLLGLFEYDDMKYFDEENHGPTLEEMTEKAIEILSKNPNGYFLLIEGAKIDKAHHDNQALRAILETIEFDKAITVAEKLSNPKDTLLVVTADHSHTMTLGSYMNRDTDITAMNVGYYGPIGDDRGQTSLLYGNGPGYKIPRMNITKNTVFKPDSVYNSGVPLEKGTHGGEEVTVYARGPWGHLLKDIYEQSYIGNVMMFASCTGSYDDRKGCNSSTSVIYHPMILAFLISMKYFYYNL